MVQALVDKQVGMKGHGSKGNQRQGMYSLKTLWSRPDASLCLERLPGPGQ